MKVLLIDDIRGVSFIKQKYNIDVTHIARTYQSGIAQLMSDGPFDLLLLDHDLASFDDDGNELTGYTVMCFLEEHPEYLPKEIKVVSSNPVGRDNICAVINKLYKE